MNEHEQVNDKCVALSTRCTKMTARLMAQMMQAFLKKMTGPKIKRGRQSLKSLTKQGASISDIEISGENIGSFKKVAREFRIDYALKKDLSVDPPRWTVFFKASDDKSIQSAFNKYASITLKQKSKGESMLDKLDKSKELARAAPEKVIERVKNKAVSL